MINGSCHCGAVKFELAVTPEWLTVCNCSICRRLGALWAHAEATDIRIICEDGATTGYAQGDKTLAIHTCKTCGCTTHWEGLPPDTSSRMAVNCAMSDPDEIATLRVRHFDGADSWAYLD